LLVGDGLGDAILGGVLASPFIGWGVAVLTQARFHDAGGIGRSCWSLASLYAGGVAFGICCGCARLLALGSRSPLEVMLEPVLAVLWGMTVTGFFLFLGPLTYLTHWLLDRQLEG
jgi:hypothetical protein